MRSEEEMLDLILDTARSDQRIRAVLLNGSRANPNAPRDPFQDFDIVYLVNDVTPFRINLEWITQFGELMILQMPDEMKVPTPDPGSSFAYLMQFTDGNRIDLTVAQLEIIDQFTQDSLTEILLDKDNRIDPIHPADDRDYLPKSPTAKEYANCCNEFWWVSPYVAKGLWREEILYAKHSLDRYLRPQLMKMVTWYAGIKTGFSTSPGKDGKYLQALIESEIWEQLLKTYSDADYEHTWTALYITCDLFREIASQVGEHFGFSYPSDEDQRVSNHLKHINSLPRDAKEIY